VSVELSVFQRRLCNALQCGLPVCQRPFAALALRLGVTEQQVLAEIDRLKRAGIIRRIRAITNLRALGFTSTLVAAHVPNDRLDGLVEQVNTLPGVSHNYLRRHHYNLWFTLTARTRQGIDEILDELSRSWDIEFHSLAVKRVFKLDVRFDAQGCRHLLSSRVDERPGPLWSEAPVELDDRHKRLLSSLHIEFPLCPEPFAELAVGPLRDCDLCEMTAQLLRRGLIRRIAAVLDQRKLGFFANALFVAAVDDMSVVEAGQAAARCEVVSHCYERTTFEAWPYNLFAMMHAPSMEQIRYSIEQLVESCRIGHWELLPTVAELKKQPVGRLFELE